LLDQNKQTKTAKQGKGEAGGLSTGNQSRTEKLVQLSSTLDAVIPSIKNKMEKAGAEDFEV